MKGQKTHDKRFNPETVRSKYRGIKYVYDVKYQKKKKKIRKECKNYRPDSNRII